MRPIRPVFICWVIGLVAALAPPVWAGAAEAPDDLPVRALAILATHCAPCHGGARFGGADEGGFDHVLDPEAMIADGQIARSSPDGSELYRRMHEREMPPRSARTRPTEAEMAVVREWIAQGANAPARPEKKRVFLSDREVDRVIARDLAARTGATRRQTRYVSLVPLYNAGMAEDDLAIVRQATVKLLNSLSWAPRVYVPEAIDERRVLYRVELDALGWTDETWDAITRHDPYAIARTTAEARSIRAYTGALSPLVRADWFVVAASAPPLYHEILRIPESASELESELGVDQTLRKEGTPERPDDVADDLRRHRAIRAGFNGSGVSQNNRVIERHALVRGGYYWQSYDFQSSAGRRNIFDLPLEFRRDGGEMIFSLPNGMQGYMIVDAGGRRIDKAPVAIVADPSRPDRAVTNGVSCMGCHSAGIIVKKDEIRQHVLANRQAFERAGRRVDVDEILAIYAPDEVLSTAFAGDRARFEGALARAGVTAPTEPINVVVQMFEAELGLARVAAELGLPAAELARALARQGDLGRKLGALLVSGGTVKRDAFTADFARAAGVLGRGQPITTVSRVDRLDLVCDTGSAASCLAGGQAYYYRGGGVSVDRVRARQFFVRACSGQDASERAEQGEGCRLLGHIHFRGDGVPRDTRRALSLYQRACSKGSAPGCGHVGFLYEHGTAVAADPVQAAQFYARACQLGQGTSCFTLGGMFYDGRSIARNRDRAAFYFEGACTLGVAAGCARIGDQYRWGKGVRADWIRSYNAFRRACTLGDKDSCAQVLDLAGLLDLR